MRKRIDCLNNKRLKAVAVMTWLSFFAITLHSTFVFAQTAAIVGTQVQIKRFLGNHTGILMFVDANDNARIKWVDLGVPDLSVHTLSGVTQCSNPILNKDGKRAAYIKGEYVYAFTLADPSPVEIGRIGTGRSGAVGYWYREAGADYIMYADATDKFGYQDGNTYLQKVNGIQPHGQRTQIYNKAYDSGITPDGKWIGESYGGLHAYNRVTQKEYSRFYKADGETEGQCCNGSMALDGTERYLCLVLPHEYIRLWRYNSSKDRWEEAKTFAKPPGTYEWQCSEFSTHGDYFTATATKEEGGDYDLYLVNATTSDMLKVVQGNISNSHLYVAGSASTSQSVSRLLETRASSYFFTKAYRPGLWIGFDGAYSLKIFGCAGRLIYEETGTGSYIHWIQSRLVASGRRVYIIQGENEMRVGRLIFSR